MPGFLFTLTKTATFEAAHRLIHHDGKCARLHGHSWRVSVEVGADGRQDKGPKRGMAVDFYDVGLPLKDLVEQYLDHHYLNDTLQTTSPTSESVAVWVYERLEPIYDKLGVTLTAVTVEETCTSRARYEP